MKQQNNIANPITQVNVITSARLHMGFFDLSGSKAPSYGSLGMSIDAPCAHIELKKNDITLIDTKSSENVAKIVENIVNSFNITQNFSLKIHESIPAHTGLGSGTQLALAIGAGLNQLFNLNLSHTDIAKLAKRGKRSGIGIAAFEQGGVLVDTGKTNDALPQIALRHDFPDDWRVLLVNDTAKTGVHGEAELQAFQLLKPAQNSLRDMMFNHMMPALQRGDLLAFGAYMADLQAYNGDYFAPVQGGQYASHDVADVLSDLQNQGVVCAGQSSWGPSGFAVVGSVQQAQSLQKQVQLAFNHKPNICVQICKGKNTGASIQVKHSN